MLTAMSAASDHAAPPAPPAPPAWRAWHVADGSLEALKWLGLIAMTLDHINTFLLAGREPLLYAVGRLAFPLFAFVLAYNMARPGAAEPQHLMRVATRLLAFALLATVPMVGLGLMRWGWWPLNILFTFLVAVLLLALHTRGHRLHRLIALLLFVIGGALVDYFWIGLALTLAAWQFLRKPSRAALALWVALVTALSLLAWWLRGTSPLLSGAALLSFALILAAARIELPVPRLRWLFYAYYPAHLALLWAIQRAWLGP